MTLLLTECSMAGVVMAADSAITMMRKGRIVDVDQSGWKKVLRVPRVHAAVGFWGEIGRIHSQQRFDEWLKQEIERATYSDLPSLAAALADTLNKACQNKPLGDDQCAGLHVAGYHTWEDGERRPFFFHVHNGPGEFKIEQRVETDPVTHTNRLLEVRPRYVAGPRTLFEPHQDFPSKEISLEQNLNKLEYNKHTTRNGAFYYYTVMWESLEHTFAYLNHIEGFRIPRDDSLGARRGLLIAALETTVRLYKCSNQSRIVGGEVSSVAIGPNGYLRR